MPRLSETGCDATGNPLTTLRRQAESDSSVKQDRLRNGGGIEESFRSKQATVEDETDAQKAFNNFATQNAQFHSAPVTQPTGSSNVPVAAQTAQFQFGSFHQLLLSDPIEPDFENIWGSVTNQQAEGMRGSGLLYYHHPHVAGQKSVKRSVSPSSMIYAQPWDQVDNMQSPFTPNLVPIPEYEAAMVSPRLAQFWKERCHRVNEQISRIVDTEMQHFITYGTLMDHEKRLEYSEPSTRAVLDTLTPMPGQWEYALHYVDLYQAAVKRGMPELEKAVLKKLQDKDIKMPDVNKGLKRTNTSDEASNVQWIGSNAAHNEGLGSLSTNWVSEYSTFHGGSSFHDLLMQPAIEMQDVQFTLKEDLEAQDELVGTFDTSKEEVQKACGSYHGKERENIVDEAITDLQITQSGWAQLLDDDPFIARDDPGSPEFDVEPKADGFARYMSRLSPAAVNTYQSRGASMADEEARLDDMRRLLSSPNEEARQVGQEISDLRDALQLERVQHAAARAEIADMRRETAHLQAEAADLRAQAAQLYSQIPNRTPRSSITSHSVMFQLIDKVYSAERPSSLPADPFYPASCGNGQLAELVLSHHATKIIQMEDDEELQTLRRKYIGFHDDLSRWLVDASADYEEVVEDAAGNWMVRLRDDAVGKVKAKL